MRIEKIPEDAVRIAGTIEDYVDPRGKIYGYNRRNNQSVYPYMKEQHEVFGYMYVPINYISGRKTKRAHRVVAEAFIPNPDNLPVVMHKNNNKKDNRVSNLKWGTVSQNTKQAFEDGFAHNAKGVDDSQSIPCDMYETATNKFVRTFGSCKEASRFTGIDAGTIARQVQNSEMPVRKTYYFTRRNEGSRDHEIIVMLDFCTDQVLGQFANCHKAALASGVEVSTVNSNINLKMKPRWSKSGYYFKRMYLKCEEVIEIQRESRVGCA